MPTPSKQPSGQRRRIASLLRRVSARQPKKVPALWKEPIGWRKRVLNALPAKTRHRLRMKDGLSERIPSLRILPEQITELERGFQRSLKRQRELRTDLLFRAPETFREFIRLYEKLLAVSSRSRFERQYDVLSHDTHLFSLSSQALADLEGLSRTLRDASRLFERRRKQAAEHGFRDRVFKRSFSGTLADATRWHRLFELEQKARERRQQF